MIGIKARLTGIDDVQDVLMTMRRGAANKVMRPALVAAAIIVRDQMRTEAPVGKGAADRGKRRVLRLLRKSIGWKVKTYRTNVVAIIGPRKGFKTIVEGRPYDPVKYAHIVENGRGPVVIKEKQVLSDGLTIYGKKVRATRPNPFMRRAFTATESRAMQKINAVASAKIVSMMI